MGEPQKVFDLSTMDKVNKVTQFMTTDIVAYKIWTDLLDSSKA